MFPSNMHMKPAQEVKYAEMGFYHDESTVVHMTDCEICIVQVTPERKYALVAKPGFQMWFSISLLHFSLVGFRWPVH